MHVCDGVRTKSFPKLTWWIPIGSEIVVEASSVDQRDVGTYGTGGSPLGRDVGLPILKPEPHCFNANLATAVNADVHAFALEYTVYFRTMLVASSVLHVVHLLD